MDHVSAAAELPHNASLSLCGSSCAEQERSTGKDRQLTMKKYADVITGAIGLVIGIAVLVMSIQIGISEGQAIGADFLPKIVSVMKFLKEVFFF